jgi:hypothetical protein
MGDSLTHAFHVNAHTGGHLVHSIRMALLAVIRDRLAGRVESYPGTDEIYFSADPASIHGADGQRALTDCHYDGGIRFLQGRFLRALVSLTPSGGIQTCFPTPRSDATCSSIEQGEYHVLDFNSTVHCVIGQQSGETQRRILLKLHFVWIPPGHDRSQALTKAWLSSTWNKVVRFCINATTAPSTPWQRFLALVMTRLMKLRSLIWPVSMPRVGDMRTGNMHHSPPHHPPRSTISDSVA